LPVKRRTASTTLKIEDRSTRLLHASDEENESILKSYKNRQTPSKTFEAGNTVGKGRPKGSLNKPTVALRELFSRDAVVIGEKVLTMAKKGDPKALRVVMDRIFPARRGAPAPWNMPTIKPAPT
jgi:hypothetical protein